MAYDDLLSFGSEAAVKEAGKLSIEGKEYIVRRPETSCTFDSMYNIGILQSCIHWDCCDMGMQYPKRNRPRGGKRHPTPVAWRNHGTACKRKTDAWNPGDIPSFMSGAYWADDSMCVYWEVWNDTGALTRHCRTTSKATRILRLMGILTFENKSIDESARFRPWYARRALALTRGDIFGGPCGFLQPELGADRR